MNMAPSLAAFDRGSRVLLGGVAKDSPVKYLYKPKQELPREMLKTLP